MRELKCEKKERASLEEATKIIEGMEQLSCKKKDEITGRIQLQKEKVLE